MINYLVIGICLFLLIAVIYIASKPISMGIEARRNFKDDKTEDKIENLDENSFSENQSESVKYDIKLSEEIIKLNELKEKGSLTQDEFEKAKKKLLS